MKIVNRLRSKNLILVLRIILMVAPFVWLYFKIDFSHLGTSLKAVKWTLLLAIIGIWTSCMFLQGLRFWILLRSFIAALPFGRAIAVHFAGIYYSIALPSSGSMDVVRAVLISNKENYPAVWGATAVARLSGVVAIALVALVGVAIKESAFLHVYRPYLLLAGVVIALCIILVFSKRVTRPIRLFLARIIPEKFMTIGNNIRDGLYLYRNKHVELSLSFFISLVMQIANILNATLLAYGICGDFPFFEMLLIMPFIEFVCFVLPLTPGGTGIREALIAVFFTQMGLSPEEISIYITVGLLQLPLRLIGAFAIPFLPKKQAHA